MVALGPLLGTRAVSSCRQWGDTYCSAQLLVVAGSLAAGAPRHACFSSWLLKVHAGGSLDQGSNSHCQNTRKVLLASLN